MPVSINIKSLNPRRILWSVMISIISLFLIINLITWVMLLLEIRLEHIFLYQEIIILPSAIIPTGFLVGYSQKQNGVILSGIGISSLLILRFGYRLITWGLQMVRIETILILLTQILLASIFGYLGEYFSKVKRL